MRNKLQITGIDFRDKTKGKHPKKAKFVMYRISSRVPSAFPPTKANGASNRFELQLSLLCSRGNYCLSFGISLSYLIPFPIAVAYNLRLGYCVNTYIGRLSRSVAV